MDKDVAESWRNCFRQWPSDLERRGVLVTSFGEQVVFDGFATSDDMLLLERKAPDTVGARTVILPFQNIQALKIVDVTKVKTFQPMGFTAPLSTRK
jgi:hypothetical protein